MSKSLPNTSDFLFDPILFACIGQEDVESFKQTGFNPILYTLQQATFSQVVILTSSPEGMIYFNELATQMPDVPLYISYFLEINPRYQANSVSNFVGLLNPYLRGQGQFVFFLTSMESAIASVWINLRDESFPNAQLLRLSEVKTLQLVDVYPNANPVTSQPLPVNTITIKEDRLNTKKHSPKSFDPDRGFSTLQEKKGYSDAFVKISTDSPTTFDEKKESSDTSPVNQPSSVKIAGNVKISTNSPTTFDEKKESSDTSPVNQPSSVKVAGNNNSSLHTAIIVISLLVVYHYFSVLWHF